MFNSYILSLERIFPIVFVASIRPPVPFPLSPQTGLPACKTFLSLLPPFVF